MDFSPCQTSFTSGETGFYNCSGGAEGMAAGLKIEIWEAGSKEKAFRRLPDVIE
jgi:hypothetical protein